MEKIHHLFFCTQCGFKLSGQEYVCPSCGSKLAEPPVTVQPEIPKVENIPVTEPVKEVVSPQKDTKPAETIQKDQTTSAIIKTESVKKKKGLGIVWLMVIIFFGIVIIGGGTVAFLQYNGNISIALLKDFIPSKNTVQFSDTTKQKSTSEKNIQDKQQSDGQNIDTLQTTANSQNSTNNTTQNETSDNSKNNGMRFFIIAGSYSTQQLAQEAVGNMKAKGYPDAKVVGQNEKGSWRICYKSYSTQQEAMQNLDNIRQKDNPSAWIFELK